MKVGDKVKITDTDYGSPELRNGVIGRIEKVWTEHDGKEVDPPVYGVRVDGFPNEFDLSGQSAWNFYGTQIEVI